MAVPTQPLYPNPLAADSDKGTQEFGLKVMKSCYNKWANGFGSESWVNRVKRYDKNRKYAAGKQDTTQYRDVVNVEGLPPLLNIDYTPLPIAIPFLNRIKDRYMQRTEKIRCQSVDPFSQSKKRKAKEDDRFKMQYRDQIQQVQQEAGMELEQFSEDDPKNEQELDIKYGFTYKGKEEIIMELGTKLVFDDNDWDDVIKERLIFDTATCGFAVTHTEVDGSGKIRTPFIKPERFITSYSEFNDFRDWQYQGQVRDISIMEIRLRFPGKISEEALYNLAKSNAGKMGNPTWGDYSYTSDSTRAIARPWDNYTVQVVDLHYKTLYNLKYERKQNRFGGEVLKKTNVKEEGKEYEESKPYYVAYHGVWIKDTDILLKWELARNMLKPNDNLTEVFSPYSVYMHDNNRCTNTPLIETMIPSIDLMQNIHLTTLRIIAATAPDGADIDVSGLSEIDMGAGVGNVSPLQLYAIYLQTGNRYFKRMDDADENPNGQPPISPQNHQYSNKLEQLDAKWQREYEKLQQIVGSSNLDAGYITNQATSNVTLQSAKTISASATNFIYNAYLAIMKRTAKKVQIALWDKFVYGENSYDGYIKALGKDNIDFLNSEAMDDFEKTNFDVAIEAVVDDGEMQRLNQRIEIALSTQQITIEDSIMLDMIENPKYKAAMLAARAKQKMADDIKKATINAQNNTEQAKAAAAAKGEADLQVEQQKHANEVELLTLRLQSMQKEESFKFNGILKAKVVDAILAKPNATIEQIPDWVFDGLELTNDAQKQMMIEALQAMQPAQQDQQQPQQNGAPTDPNTQQQGQMINVVMPDGQRGQIPEENYEAFAQQYPDHEVEQEQQEQYA